MVGAGAAAAADCDVGARSPGPAPVLSTFQVVVTTSPALTRPSWLVSATFEVPLRVSTGASIGLFTEVAFLVTTTGLLVTVACVVGFVLADEWLDDGPGEAEELEDEELEDEELEDEELEDEELDDARGRRGDGGGVTRARVGGVAGAVRRLLGRHGRAAHVRRDTDAGDDGRDQGDGEGPARTSDGAQQQCSNSRDVHGTPHNMVLSGQYASAGPRVCSVDPASANASGLSLRPLTDGDRDPPKGGHRCSERDVPGPSATDPALVAAVPCGEHGDMRAAVRGLAAACHPMPSLAVTAFGTALGASAGLAPGPDGSARARPSSAGSCRSAGSTTMSTGTSTGRLSGRTSRSSGARCATARSGSPWSWRWGSASITSLALGLAARACSISVPCSRRTAMTCG